MRVISWNFQGASGGKIGLLMDYMAKNDIEVACIQESGSLPKDYLNDTETLGELTIYKGHVTRHNMTYNVVQFDASLNFGAGNDRCSVAVICAPIMLNKHLIAMDGTKLRPLLGVEVPGHMWFYSIHAPANRAAAAVSET
ncbi:MAG: hypothetical protein WDN69_19085 [Aliidongia sp.]